MRLLLIFFTLITSGINAQNCSNFPGMTPSTAIPVCGTTTFTQTIVTPCTAPEIVTNCFSNLVSGRSFWYKFRCYQPGTTGLGFTINPVSGSDDFDWTLFDVTGFTDPNVVLTNISTQVSVNLCGFTGATGCSSAGSISINCEGNTNLWNQLAPMQIGHDYLLMVTNWSNSGQGYTISFTGGDASITNNVAPTVDSVRLLNCDPTKLKVYFSKDIKCSSVTLAGSEFQITPGSFPITGIISGCATGNTAITQLTIDLSAPLPPSNYNLIINNGTDLNTFQDACSEQITPGTSIPFTVPAAAPVTITNITTSGCAPSILNVTLSSPVLCSSITPSGSEFSLSPSATITGVATNCAPGITSTDQIQVILQNPLPDGNYTLNINNGSDGNTFAPVCGMPVATGHNYSFPIAPTNAPVIQSVSFNECAPDKLIVNFDKPIACNTLSAAGTEFSITPGVWPITSISSNCGPLTTQITIDLQSNLPAGNFNVNINVGTDGNTLSDTCLASIAAGYAKAFVTTSAPLPQFDSVSLTGCNPDVIKVYYSNAIKCSSISTNGSDFTITGPSAVAITSASTNITCAQGYSNWVLLHLSQPMATPGNYTLHNTIGSDGNGIIDTCNAQQSTTETINFSVVVKPNATFNTNVRWGCVNDTIDVSHPGGNGANNWSWVFSDGTIISGQSASHYFPVSTVNAGIQLIVSNGTCSDTANATVPLNNAFNASFTQDVDSICAGQQVVFTNSSTGNGLSYDWQFGDNSVFAGHTPPPHVYNGSNSFPVLLICSDAHGCRDTASRFVYAAAAPVVSFSGLNTQYCTRDRITLQADITGTVTSYIWSNGNGQTYNNLPSISFSYNQENTYTITLTANDRFCGATTFSQSTEVYKIPEIDLGNDTMLCPQIRISIGQPAIDNYIYSWSNGATSSQITTSLNTATYTLSVNNHGCIGEDQIHVQLLEGCLIRVPGAFTPNNDGRNDRLKATNAFLAKQFTLRVYNRFGQLVYNTSDPNSGWDGRFKGQEAAAGTYVWQLSYIDPWVNQPVYQKGTSILIR